MNHLHKELSPYLLQHAHNPVNWYPWGLEAFSRAVSLDRPILLSIGYAACHWCHVMAHESFEDPVIAKIMNNNFVNIKVDREEHPDVDQLYQQALQIMIREAGGWPLTMFLTPTGEPFYGGTYFPPTDGLGRPSFRRLLEGVTQLYQTQKERLYQDAVTIGRILKNLESLPIQSERLFSQSKNFLNHVAATIMKRFDNQQGGFSKAPKFPHPSTLDLLIRTMEPAHIGPILFTLRKMAEGGIYDQLGGGFSRYSTDKNWLIPHFEKMLYDNAQLLTLYSQAYQLSKSLVCQKKANLFFEVVKQTIAWLEREMLDSTGGAYASQDADSEGIEGHYFVWTISEIKALCTPKEAEIICRCYDISSQGNWQDSHHHRSGENVLHRVAYPTDPKEEELLETSRQKLFHARQLRIKPATDTKILTSWNGLLLSGLAQAAQLFQNDSYLTMAQKCADFLLTHMQYETGVWRVYKDGQVRLPGLLDDYVFLAQGLLHLSVATSNLNYISIAQSLTEQALAKFYDSQSHCFRMTPQEKSSTLPELIVSPISLYDSAIPSGSSIMCLNLLRLSVLTPVDKAVMYRQLAEEFLSSHVDSAKDNPLGLSSLCSAIGAFHQGITTTLVVGKQAHESPLYQYAYSQYLPEHFVYALDPVTLPVEFAYLLHGKDALQGQSTAYVCQGSHCNEPMIEIEKLREFYKRLGTKSVVD